MVHTDGAREIHRQPEANLLTTKLRRGQRQLARQQKGSNRRHRTRTGLQKLRRHIRNDANTWRHWLTRQVADKAGLLVLEKLNTQGMTRSAQGTVAAPGGNVQQKAGLNHSILSTGWGEIEQMLCYKLGLCTSTLPPPPGGAAAVGRWTRLQDRGSPLFTAQAAVTGPLHGERRSRD